MTPRLKHCYVLTKGVANSLVPVLMLYFGSAPKTLHGSIYSSKSFSTQQFKSAAQ